MKVLQIWISLVALAVLISCSSLGGEGKRIDYGAGAIQVSALEVPPDLTVPGADERYKIPLPGGGSSVPGTGEGVATFSGYSKGGSVQGHAVLPEVPGVHLEHDASQRWLAVNENADDVWPVVRDFWLEIGLSIKSEDRAAGAMETDWAENRAKIPQGAIRSVLGKVFNKANTAGESDKYLVRLERSKDGKSTEVHITHFGMVQVYSPDMTSSRWQPRAEDPELEAIMLQRLMVRFGASEAQAASAVAADRKSVV